MPTAADRDEARRAERRRRLRQPLARRALPQLRRVGQPLPGARQAHRRRGRLHEQRALGRVPRLRPRPGDPRRSSRRWTSSRCALGIDPFELRRINAVREGDPLATHEEAESDVDLGLLRSRPVPRPRPAGARPRQRGRGTRGRELARRRGHGRRDDRDDGALRARLRDVGHRDARRALPRRGRHDGVRQRHDDGAHPDPLDRPRDDARARRAAQLRHGRRRPTTPARSRRPASRWPARRCTRHPSPCASACWASPDASPARAERSSWTACAWAAGCWPSPN